MEFAAVLSPNQSSGAALSALDAFLSGKSRRKLSPQKVDPARRRASRTGQDMGPLDVIERIKAGLPGGSVRVARDLLQITNKEMAKVLSREEKTIRSWSESAALTPIAGEQVLRLLKVYFVACSVLEDKDEAVAWLKEPSEPLGGRIPLELLATFEGESLVMGELMQMEYGHPV